MILVWISAFGRAKRGAASHSVRSWGEQALRQVQDRPFGKLRTGPSAGSGQALRQAQGERKTLLRRASW